MTQGSICFKTTMSDNDRGDIYYSVSGIVVKFIVLWL